MKGVTDALRRLDGVAAVHVDLQSNRVVVDPARDVELDLAAIPRAVRRAGFTPADMELVARGAFERRGDEILFRITGWTRALPVRLQGAPGEDGAPGREQELRARVDFGTDPPVLSPIQR